MTTPDPRLHGPATCPVAPAGCEACSGYHHWLDDGFDPEADPAELHPHELAVLAHDKEHGTDHSLAFFGCKHCDAWAESDYVWDLEEEAQQED